MTTRLSQFNNTGLPLNTGATFTGLFERTLTGLEITTFVNSSSLSLVTIEQSVDASNVRVTTTFNYNPENDVSTFSVPIALPFFRVKLLNADVAAQAYLSLNTYVINTPPQQVVIAGGTADVIVGGIVDVSGNVVASNLITETLATRRVDFLVVGDWYRVASVGLTSGAEWQALSGGTACVGGQSVPDIGRLFQAVAVGPAVAGGGEVYDIEYTEAVSATITNFPSFPATQPISGTVSLTDPTTVRVRDSNGDPLLTTAGNLMVGISNIYTANPLHTIVDSGPATQAVTGTVSLTSPTTVRVADYYGDPITTTAGNTNININAISTATALHTIVDSGPATQAVTGTFYQATQPVSIASSVAVTGTFFQATQPVSLPSTSVSNNLSATNSGVSIKNSAGQLISLFMNCNGSSGTDFVKIYNLSSPTSTDTPVLVIALQHATSQNVDCVNLSFNTAIGLRVTANAANNDNTAPTNTVNVSAFYI